LQDASIGTVPLWRSPIAGDLPTNVVLVGATVAAAIWLSILDDRRQAQDLLMGQASQAALAIPARHGRTAGRQPRLAARRIAPP
jgi:hypothetical protein